MNTDYCNNDKCFSGNTKTPIAVIPATGVCLCESCSAAYALGQEDMEVSQDRILVSVDDYKPADPVPLIFVISEETGETIAVTYRQRNAQLVAAAPDLLDACQELLTLLTDGGMASEFASEETTLEEESTLKHVATVLLEEESTLNHVATVLLNSKKAKKAFSATQKATEVHNE